MITQIVIVVKYKTFKNLQCSLTENYILRHKGLFKYFDTTILVLNDEVSNKTYEQELTEDLISIIHYFTAKSYSHICKLNKLKRELESEEQ